MSLQPSSTPKRTRFRLVEIAPRGTEGAGNETSVGSGGDVPFNILVPSTQSVDAFEITTPTGVVLFAIDQNGNVKKGGVTAVSGQVTQVALTAAQITTLHSAPVSLVAAPGAGKAILVHGTTVQFKYGTTQFTGGGAVNPVYHGATTNLLSGSVAAATIQAAASATVSCGAEAAALALSSNTGVDLYAGTADFAAGDSTAIVTIWYDVITLG